MRLSGIATSLFLGTSVATMPQPIAAQSLLQNLKKELKQIPKPKVQLPKGKDNAVAKVIGGVAGAALGNKISDGDALGVIIGTAIGVIIANEIAKDLSEQQQSKVANATTNAVVSGESETWVDPETQKTNSVTVISTTQEKNSVTVPVDREKVSVVPNIDLVGEIYTVEKNSNVRSGPGTSYEKVGRLAAASQINVVGRVEDEPWLLVSTDGVASGYVYEPLLSPTSRAIIQTEPPQTLDEPLDQDVIVVASVQECRTVEQSIGQAQGENVSETLKACKGATGWAVEVVPAIAIVDESNSDLNALSSSASDAPLPIPVLPGAVISSSNETELTGTNQEVTVSIEESSAGRVVGEIGAYRFETLVGEGNWCAPHVAVRADHPAEARPEFIVVDGKKQRNSNAPIEVTQFALALQDDCSELRSLLVNYNPGTLGKTYFGYDQQTTYGSNDGFVAPTNYKQLELVLESENAQRCDELAAFALDPDKPIGIAGINDTDFTATDEALEACINAVLAEPDVRRHRAHLGRVLAFRGDFESAVDEFKAGKALGSGTSMSYLGTLTVEGWGVPENLDSGNREWTMAKYYGQTPFTSVEAISIAAKAARATCDNGSTLVSCKDYRDVRRANARKVEIVDGQVNYLD